MPSAYEDKSGWIADFRGLHQAGRQHRTTRVPRDQLRACHELEDARSYAVECARLCRLCETASPVAKNIERAEQMGAITREQAAALRVGQRPPTAADLRTTRVRTIEAAASAHPSSRREPHESQKDHLRALRAFCAWAKSDLLDALTIEKVSEWIALLQKQGRAYDTIRHDILWLRRASRMAGAMGLPDPLSRMVMHRRERGRRVTAWTFEELSALLLAARAAGDGRLEAVVLLGGWAGLRPSEICRLEVRDLVDGVLSVAERAAKNDASPRRLPLPPTMARALAALCSGRAPTNPLIWSEMSQAKGERNRPLSDTSLPTWFKRAVWGDRPRPPKLAAAMAAGAAPPRTGPMPTPSYLGACRTLPAGTPETLRKAFMSWAIRRSGVPQPTLERWFGHTITGMPLVTQRHYYADLEVAELLPVAKAIEAELPRTYKKSLQSRK